ncbi:PilT protein domain protein [Candidatus Nitrospira nitrosa]|uniref:PilT protein domain protein n=1 Tax=Candidatus Nitrospira nitrosa TaxID=1742972 RepID=A0A0S4L3I5_9BACT|nr:putative toxin-antitoxin system toxin component, PIN family [Candidatus Nitrospira nitrosa]CUS32085.1 PilT protein domain protein [Candidatus Nitrospira nitrosa]
MLDTDVIISALLFSGPPSQLVSAWHSSRLRPVVSAPILDGYIRVLAYPKFELTPAEIRSVIEEEFLPFIESVKAIPTTVAYVRDPDDAKFIACAAAAGVRWLVSRDDDLLSLRRIQSVEIVSITEFLCLLKAE